MKDNNKLNNYYLLYCSRNVLPENIGYINIDFLFKDELGREIQIPTVQLDFTMPKRFGLSYVDENGEKQVLSKRKWKRNQLYPDDLNVVTLCCDRRIIAFCTGNRSQYGMLYILYRFYFMGDFAYFKILSKSCLSKKK